MGGGGAFRGAARPYGGRSADDYDEGFAIYGEVGAEAVAGRAAAAVAEAPAEVVLAGVSMGAGLVSWSWGGRPASRGALLIAGLPEWAEGLRRGLPVQAHIARPDPFDPEEVFADWVAADPGAALELHCYDGVGHYFLDPALPDYDAVAARACRARMQAFLAAL